MQRMREQMQQMREWVQQMRERVQKMLRWSATNATTATNARTATNAKVGGWTMCGDSDPECMRQQGVAIGAHNLLERRDIRHKVDVLNE